MTTPVQRQAISEEQTAVSHPVSAVRVLVGIRDAASVGALAQSSRPGAPVVELTYISSAAGESSVSGAVNCQQAPSLRE